MGHLALSFREAAVTVQLDKWRLLMVKLSSWFCDLVLGDVVVGALQFMFLPVSCKGIDDPPSPRQSRDRYI
jgi:hypothetical protein